MTKEFIGIDLGGTKTIIAVANEDGKIKDSVKFATPNDLKGGLEKIIESVRKLSLNPAAIGCACGGPLDYRNGVVSPVHMPEWRGVPLKETMEKEFGCPFFVDVDTNVAALGEHRFGKAGQFRNFIYITLSTGMGAGKLVDGKIYRGLGHPEMAHQSFAASLDNANGFDLSSHRCECGAEGCLEAFVSGNAIRRIYGKPAEEITDPKILEEIAKNFGEGLRNIIALHSPDAIFIGGGIAYGLGDRLLVPAENHAKQNLKIVPFPEIRLASLGYDSALMGSIALAINPDSLE
ncbi:MAG: ROK family protein [Candidatus Aenigmarchaeota archaeon]|nr:ROK family protein [Candidatus Aenigmarchaeota archaeon]